MIAEIIPILRLPPMRDVGARGFDYFLTNEGRAQGTGGGAQGTPQPGSLVIVPWRKNKIFGVVLKIKKTSSVPKNKIAQVLKVFPGAPLVPQDLINVWSELADTFNMSLSTIAKTTLLPLKKTKIQKIRVGARAGAPAAPASASTAASAAAPKKKQEIYFNYSSFEQRSSFIKKTIKSGAAKSGAASPNPASGQFCIIAPTMLSARNIAAEVPGSVFYSKELTDKEKFDIWINVRRGKIKIIVGTKSAIFLPYADLRAIFIDDEANENHTNWDQSPRYNASAVAKFRAGLLNCSAYYMGFAPSSEMYYKMKIGEIKKAKGGSIISGERIQIIDSVLEKKIHKNFFSESTEEALKNIKKGIVFIYINRKGFARSVKCSDCTYTFVCGSCALPFASSHKTGEFLCFRCGTKKRIPLSCPKCGGNNLRGYGSGTERVAAILKDFAAQNNIAIRIMEINSEKTSVSFNGDLTWIVGTNFAVEKIPWNDVRAVIMPRIDLDLMMPSYKSSEHAYHEIMSFLLRSRYSRAKIIIETSLPNYPLFKAAAGAQPHLLFDEEFKWRSRFGWPPIKTAVKFFPKNKVGPAWNKSVQKPVILRFEPKDVKYKLKEFLKDKPWLDVQFV